MINNKCKISHIHMEPRWLSGKGYQLTGRGSGSGSIPGSNIYFKIKIV